MGVPNEHQLLLEFYTYTRLRTGVQNAHQPSSCTYNVNE